MVRWWKCGRTIPGGAFFVAESLLGDVKHPLSVRRRKHNSPLIAARGMEEGMFGEVLLAKAEFGCQESEKCESMRRGMLKSFCGRDGLLCFFHQLWGTYFLSTLFGFARPYLERGSRGARRGGQGGLGCVRRSRAAFPRACAVSGGHGRAWNHFLRALLLRETCLAFCFFSSYFFSFGFSLSSS